MILIISISEESTMEVLNKVLKKYLIKANNQWINKERGRGGNKGIRMVSRKK